MLSHFTTTATPFPVAGQQGIFKRQRPFMPEDPGMSGPVPPQGPTRTFGNDAIDPRTLPGMGQPPAAPQAPVPLQPGPMQTPMPQRQVPPSMLPGAPDPSAMLGTGPTAPPGAPPSPNLPGFSELIAPILDPGPYNQAVDQGNRFIRQSIPTNANSVFSSSPSMKNMSPAMRNTLNNQFQARGTDMQNQARLEFSRKAGTEVPQFLLNQLLGLRGLESDWGDLQNDFYRNNVDRTTGGIDALLRILGAVGSFI